MWKDNNLWKGDFFFLLISQVIGHMTAEMRGVPNSAKLDCRPLVWRILVCVRLQAGDGRGVDVQAGAAGPVPEDAGDRPGVCSWQEGWARSVSSPSRFIAFWSWSIRTEVPALTLFFFLHADGIMPLRTRSPLCRVRPRTAPTPTAARSRPTCRCFWRQPAASTLRLAHGSPAENLFVSTV